VPVEFPVSDARGTTHCLTVASAEAEMKLVRFLQRRLRDDTPLPVLHKWIRSGQVRVNGGRRGPFAGLAQDDIVRLPPFAVPTPVSPDNPPPVTSFGPGLELVAVSGDLLVLNKSAGLSCHPGSAPGRRAGNATTEDSVSARLSTAFSAHPYIPAPAHRLDKRTSGLLLAGLTHVRARCLHDLFRQGGIAKYYLAWVRGRVPWIGARVLEDRMESGFVAGRERARALPSGHPENPPPCASVHDAGPAIFPCGREKFGNGRALCAALVLRQMEARSLPPDLRPVSDNRSGKNGRGATLLLLRPLTGLKHQLRAQLAARGFPLIGDPLYGGPPFRDLLLHAYALCLPRREDAEENAPEIFMLSPPWGTPFVPEEASLRREISGQAGLPPNSPGTHPAVAR
jgi:23S rRNA pseudouridine955/2504/2580 synthase